jgi:serine/threonine protein kinase
LGEGTSAKVYLAINEQTNKKVAIKVIPKAQLNSDPKSMELVKTEIYILKTCNNDNVVKCYDVFQTDNSIFIVMEYCNGLDMQNYVSNKLHLSEDHAVWYLKQMLNGFKGLH